jgi:ribosomal protein S4
MLSRKKSRFKPIFKPILKLRDNVQNRQKILKFKKSKWNTFLKFYLNKLKNFRKFKCLDQPKHFVTRYGTRGASYNKRFKTTLQAGKKFRIFYGNLLKKSLKEKIKISINKKNRTSTRIEPETVLLQFFESRLDVVLYRAKFAPTIRSAQQLLLHGKISVNEKKVNTKTYLLKKGDIIKMNFNSLNLYEVHVLNCTKWAIPPKYLLINYRTLQIVFLGDLQSYNLSNEFSFNLRIQKILTHYYRQ